MRKAFCFLAGLVLCVSLSGQAVKDTTRVLCIGNSFTYVAVAHEKLAEIALSEGHYLDMTAVYVGGYTFYRHLSYLPTQKAIEQFTTPWEYAFLQNQSQINALYGRNPKQHRLACKDAVDLVDRIRQYSPEASVFIECTWAYSGYECGGFASVEEYDKYLQKGTAMMAKAAKTEVSPIGQAFALVRSERPDINLYQDDDKHQWEYGSYLKACVNYLCIFGSRFDDAASCCGLNPSVCKYLQSVAERIVL